MARNPIAIDYGPPGVSGVSTIIGMGDTLLDDLPDLSEPPLGVEDALNKAALASVGLWLIGVVTNRPQLKGAGLGGAAVALGVKHFTKR